MSMQNVPVHRAPCTRAPCTCAPCTRAPCTRAPVHRAPVHRVPIHRPPCTRAPYTRAKCTRAPSAVHLCCAPCTSLPVHRAPVHPCTVHPCSVHPCTRVPCTAGGWYARRFQESGPLSLTGTCLRDWSPISVRYWGTHQQICCVLITCSGKHMRENQIHYKTIYVLTYTILFTCLMIYCYVRPRNRQFVNTPNNIFVCLCPVASLFAYV